MSIVVCRLGILMALSLLFALPAAGCGPGETQPEQAADSGGPSDAGSSGTGPGEGISTETPPSEAELLAEGKKAWRPCAACHCAADTRISEDADWVKLNEETT